MLCTARCEPLSRCWKVLDCWPMRLVHFQNVMPNFLITVHPTSRKIRSLLSWDRGNKQRLDKIMSFASCSDYSKIIISIILICILGYKISQSCQTALGFFTFVPRTFISTVFNVKNWIKRDLSLWQNGFKTKFVSKVIIKRDCCKILNFDEGMRGFLDC